MHLIFFFFFFSPSIWKQQNTGRGVAFLLLPWNCHTLKLYALMNFFFPVIDFLSIHYVPTMYLLSTNLLVCLKGVKTKLRFGGQISRRVWGRQNSLFWNARKGQCLWGRVDLYRETANRQYNFLIEAYEQTKATLIERGKKPQKDTNPLQIMWQISRYQWYRVRKKYKMIKYVP